MGNYINKKPDGNPIGYEKVTYLASIADEELPSIPEFSLIPDGLVLVSVVDNGGWDAALICDTEYDALRVKRGVDTGHDTREQHYFLIKREWVRQMADKPLESERGAK